jgi:hypothetical protein
LADLSLHLAWMVVVRHLSTRVGVMYRGKLVELAPAAEIDSCPTPSLHKIVVAAIPVADPNLPRPARIGWEGLPARRLADSANGGEVRRRGVVFRCSAPMPYRAVGWKIPPCARSLLAIGWPALRLRVRIPDLSTGSAARFCCILPH